jgi:hypothetical protein
MGGRQVDALHAHAGAPRQGDRHDAMDQLRAATARRDEEARVTDYKPLLNSLTQLLLSRLAFRKANLVSGLQEVVGHAAKTGNIGSGRTGIVIAQGLRKRSALPWGIDSGCLAAIPRVMVARSNCGGG